MLSYTDRLGTVNAKPSTTIAQDIYRTVRAELISGTMRPGQRIKLDPLASRLDVSRTVAREALMRLVGEELVEFNPQKGFAVVTLGDAEMVEISQARLIVEVAALRESILQGGLEWESRILAAHHTLSRTPMRLADGAPNPEWAIVHDDFHAALLGGVNSRYLQRAGQRLRELVELYPDWLQLVLDEPGRDAPAEHETILKHALARDVEEATAALHSHLERTMLWLLARSERSEH